MSWLPDYIALNLPNRQHRVLRWVFGILRQFTPFLQFGNTLVILRAEDIKEAFSRPEDFEIGPGVEQKMLLGEFLLGMDPWPAYFEMHGQLTDILDKRVDFAQACARRAASLIYTNNNIAERLNSGRRVDLVSCYAIPALSMAAKEFMGIKGDITASDILQSDDLFAAMSRSVGSIIASASPAPFGLQDIAERVGVEYKKFLTQEVSDRVDQMRSNPANRNNSVLDALILEDGLLQMSGPKLATAMAGVVAKLGGLILGGSTPLIKAFALILRGLIVETEWQVNDKRALEAAIGAANQGRNGVLREIMLEALRFDPVFPLLPRTVTRRTVIAEGTSRQREIAANTSVLLALNSGMFDEASISDSETFACPRHSSDYLIFGYGQHRCIGEQIAMVQLTEIIKQLLTYSCMSRSRYRGIEYDGPAVDKFWIQIAKGARREP